MREILGKSDKFSIKNTEKQWMIIFKKFKEF